MSSSFVTVIVVKNLPLEVRKKEGESISSALFRFGKRIKQSGILKEVKSRRFRARKINKRKVHLGALYRVQKEKEIARQKKYGY